jgi:hypothetical protein
MGRLLGYWWMCNTKLDLKTLYWQSRLNMPQCLGRCVGRQVLL